MLPEKQHVVSPESFDELFQKEARVTEFTSPEEEAEYQKRDLLLIARVRDEIRRLFPTAQSQASLVEDEWWPDHTCRAEISIGQFTPPLLSALRSLLTDQFKDYRILISVYYNRTETNLYVGSVALYADRALIERNLYLLARSDELKRQFAIRYYLWATSEWEREIAESFPRLQSFKAGPAHLVYQFMCQLDRCDQFTLAQSLLKRFHPEGESCSEEEEALRSRLDAFRNQERAKEIFGEPTGGKKRKSASKKKLRTVLARKFWAAFGSECIGLPPCVDQEEDFAFNMKFSGWIIRTSFWFGRNASLIHYSHGISSEARFEFPRYQGGWSIPITGIGSVISFYSWLGISSQTEWSRVMSEEVESTCDEVIEHCRHFFAVAPKLLKGLDLEKVE